YGIGVEAQLLQYTRRVVLDDDVAGLDQLAQQLPPSFRGEVERHAPLVGVQTGEDPGPLPPVRLREAQAGEKARAIGASRRLDMQDLGAQHRQDVRAERSSPERGEV